MKIRLARFGLPGDEFLNPDPVPGFTNDLRYDVDAIMSEAAKRTGVAAYMRYRMEMTARERRAA